MADSLHALSKINFIAASHAPEKYALDVRIIMRNYHEQTAGTSPSPKELRIRSELRLALYAVARRTQDLQLLITVTEQLFALPPHGPQLAFSLFTGQTLPDSVQIALLESFSPLHQLLMVNCGLSSPEGLSPAMQTWITGKLPLLEAKLNKHASGFLETAISQEIPLSRRFRVILATSKFAEGLRAQIDRRWSSGSISKLLELIRTLRLPSLLEYLSPALQSSSDQRLVELLVALRDTPGPYDQSLLEQLAELASGARREILPYAFQALAANDPVRGLDTLLSRFTDDPQNRTMLWRLLVLWDTRGFEAVYRAGVLKKRQEFCRTLLGFLLRVDPGGLASLMEAPCFSTEPDLTAIPGILLPRLQARHSERAREHLSRDHPSPPLEEQRPLSRRVAGEFHEGSLLGSVEIQETEFVDCRYLECDFENVQATRCRWTDTVFTKCRFSGSSITSCSFDRVTFTECSFTDCRFDDSALSDVTFVACTLQRCPFGGASFLRATMDRMLLSGCGFHQATLERVSISSSRVQECDFGQAMLFDATVANSDFRACSFASASLHGCDFRGLNPSACSFAGIELDNTATEDPELLLRQMRCFRESVARECTGEHAHDAFPDLSEQQMLRLLRLWFDARSMQRLKRLFLIHNTRRLRLARERMDVNHRTFFELLPLCMTRILPWEDSPPEFSWHIAGYEPSPDELARAEEVLGGALRASIGPVQQIAGIFTIGSTGTCAQTRRSDFDIWVCAEIAEWEAGAEDAMRQKLNRLCLWMEERFGADVHFFLQDSWRIRLNAFESVDMESSGTAQSLLLKEEFYRTGLKLAGHAPLWWMLTPGSSGEEYEGALEGAKALGLGYADYGYLAHIPSGEYFGASLWQIVKSFTNPFKSILKFALLETYVRRAKRPLLCELLKQGVVSGSENPLHVDPYVLLFREIWNYYCLAVDKAGLEIIRFSFLQKSGMDIDQLEELFGDELKGLYCIDDLFGREAGFFGAFAQLDFKKLLQVEQSLNRFMIKTYVRVQESLSQKGKADIDETDLSRLGRKIFTVFAPREDKIERLPYILTRSNMFEEFSFSSGQNDFGVRQWIVRGKQIDPLTNRAYLSELNTSTDLVAQLVWLVANKLYHPDIQIRTDFTVSPVTREDFSKLLAALSAALPPDSVFDTDINEGLRPERVMRSFLVVNMTMPRASEHVLEASICYSTNWGELFCRSLVVGSYRIPILPMRFIAANVDKEIDPACDYGLFAPGGAGCMAHLGMPVTPIPGPQVDTPEADKT
jgi:adenylate cyclase, class 1